MLILTRRRGERIFLGDNQEICVTLISINGGTAKIGIDAPNDLTILREEVLIRNLESENESISEIEYEEISVTQNIG